ncbi:MAG: hypothetical protein R3313_03530 [Candidatus Saccharimonadales bacterium]|nr:hypothetical protein [Candidatus Saccharimonadales bacterium]
MTVRKRATRRQRIRRADNIMGCLVLLAMSSLTFGLPMALSSNELSLGSKVLAAWLLPACAMVLLIAAHFFAKYANALESGSQDDR